MQVKEFNYQGKKLQYRIQGEGSLVVLLHGFAEDGTIWKRQFDAFPIHTLLIPDLPGSGGSEAIDDMSMEGLADAVKAMVASPLLKGGLAAAQPKLIGETDNEVVSSQSGPSPLGQTPSSEGLGEAVGRCALIGHSMGGYIALAFAEKYPELVSGLGLFHSTAFADTEEKKETRRKGIATINEKGPEAFLKSTIPTLYAPQTKDEKPELIDEQLAAAYNFSAPNLVTYYEAMMQRPDRTDVLKTTKVPVLFVMGRWDAAVPLQDGLKLCHLPSVAYIHILEHSGHNGMIEESEEANRILLEFVKSI